MALKKKPKPPRHCPQKVHSPMTLADVNLSDNAVISDLIAAREKLEAAIMQAETAVVKAKSALVAVNAAIDALD